MQNILIVPVLAKMAATSFVLMLIGPCCCLVLRKKIFGILQMQSRQKRLINIVMNLRHFRINKLHKSEFYAQAVEYQKRL